MSYLEVTMRGLSNMLYNISQNPSKENCNVMLDSIKRTLVDYNEAGGNISIIDFREKENSSEKN
ncbi:hypothetical protein G7L40_20795 [Paenibacillus polymyxa]|uniref:Uncharacterized protein n=1 Tax=Paenibacillus polymyxa TaxID=1406 RepID=A0A378Y1I6_PAEPO|nr:hypothetical protein [Paenibacillus polymyxa]MBE7896067.1 hypothetical protein [Paenibacillus polymyxa]MBG9765977.1 hypothetical protein [Paenibacillus polymyxa]MCC3256604.1 hypothetical protein [Paenibacillus polymyxa]QPK54911.1 hypothetical protein G7035_20850 [Paenibacillus polymyxa]QPK59999.1 hypothetical protein G7L40_20795 [Paenibacillus polymyxa]